MSYIRKKYAQNRGYFMNELSIVIPVYNEENAILDTIDQIDSIMSKSRIKYEIIIVNDGSTDNSANIMMEHSGNFKLINHEVNRGYGASLKTGINSSKYDIIAITDADSTYPNEKIPELFDYIKNYNMVVGKRSFKKLPNITKPAKWVITKLANYLAGYKIPDINSGLRLFHKADAVRFFNIISDGFSFTTTITLSMITNGLRVKYVPIDYMVREGKSKIRPIYDTLNFIQLIIKTVLYFNPLKIFIPVSFVLFLMSAFVLIFSYFALPRVLDTSAVVLFIASIQMLGLGMIADMIDKRI
jgi:glycosyltransferase involved in cell wall biosynthesis